MLPAARLPARSARRHRVAGAAGGAGAAIPTRTGVFLATAHPAKFREVVEPAIGAVRAAAAGARRRDRAAAAHAHRRSLDADLRRRSREAARDASLDTFRPQPGTLPARDAIPDALHVGPVARSAATGTSGRASYQQLDAADRRLQARSRARSAHGAGHAAGGVPRDGRDGRAQLPRLVLRVAAVRRGSAQQRDQRAAPAGADPVRAAAAGELVVQPRAAGDPARRRSAAGWTRTPSWPSTGSPSRACFTSRSTCSTSRASG